MASQAGMRDQLYEELNDSKIEFDLNSKAYIPFDALCRIITEKKVLRTTQIGSDHSKEVAHSIVNRAMKAFATLVLAERSDPLQDILEYGLLDEHLPLTRQRENGQRSVYLQGNGKTFKVDEWRKPDVIKTLDNQWLFQAPVFDTSGGHLTLSRECPLPFKPPRKHIGTTASNSVYSCDVYPAHYRNEGENNGYQVAIKELKTEKDFDLERKNLAAIQSLNNPHLIKHIATCQRDDAYFVIFPLANGGSLLSFWEQSNESPRNGALIMWAFKQMLGLAGATHALHNGFQGDTHCRHGDLKPANILHFEGDGGGRLVIADVGVSSIHGQPTDLRFGATMTMATTRAYEAPEAYADESKDRPRSRTYDIWSLGCVFLKFIIWLLYDVQAVKDFEHNRYDRHLNPGNSFYELRDGMAIVPQSVERGIDALKTDPRYKHNSPIRDIVNLISDKLLVPIVQNRFNAQELHTELQRIVRSAETVYTDPAKEVGPPSFVPDIFRDHQIETWMRAQIPRN